MMELNLFPEDKKSSAQVLFVNFGTEEAKFCISLLSKIRKSGINAANLNELLGFGSYATAWRWQRKLRRCTIRKDRVKLSQRVGVDDFFIGVKKLGRRGRGAYTINPATKYLNYAA